MIKYELWEVDIVLKKKFKNVGTKDTLDEARTEAKKLAEAWCEDEVPYKLQYGKRELWIGDSDFGILIVPVETGGTI